MPVALTDSVIRRLMPRDAPYEVRDAKLRGFLLRIQPTGRKTFYFSYRTPGGKRNRFKIGEYGVTSVAQARDIAKTRAADVVHGKDIQGERSIARKDTLERRERTLELFMDRHYKPWVITHRKSGLETIDRIKRDFSSFNRIPVDEISVHQIEKWRSQKLRDGVMASTLNRSTSALRAALGKAVEWNLIDKNPLALLKRLREDSQPKVRYLSDDELERLLKALRHRDCSIIAARQRGNEHRAKRGHEQKPTMQDCRFGDRLTPMVVLSLKTGIRRGELFDLRVEDIDLKALALTVRADSSKSGKSRSIPMSKSAIEYLEAWLDQSGNQAGRVFPADSGGRLVSLKKSFAAVLKAAQVSNFRWHDMRHDFASRLVMKGVPLNTVRELCGHADLTTTLRYAHLAPDHKSEAVALLG